MLSIGVYGDDGGAAWYHDAHLEQDEYYTASPGRWHRSRATNLLGLPDQVSADDFRSLASGQAPGGGRLVQVGKKHREGWDLTFSAPKSVSVLWSQAAPGQQAAIAEAHQRAVTGALQLTELLALRSRTGKGGTGRLPADIVAAIFQHESSRAEDPQLHSHAFVYNTALRADGKWATVDSQLLYKWQTVLGTAYRSQLAEELRQLGYAIKEEKQAFSVVGIPDAVCQEFSRRREEITRKASEHGATSAYGMEMATLTSRAAKLGSDPDTLRREWRRRGEAIGFGMLQARQLRRAAIVEVKSIDVGELLSDLTRTKAVFRVQDLWRAVAEKVQVAGGGIKRIEAVVGELLHGEELVPLLDERYTTRAMLELEGRAMEAARRLAGRSGYQSLRDACARSLSGEQEVALAHVLGDSGLAVLEGRAGTGKSYMLGGAKECWEADGRKVIGAALSGKAADSLKEGSGIPSQTLHSLLAAIESGNRRLDPRTVLVIDEAGMVGTNQMHQLLQAAADAGAKVVLVGDSRQLQSIDAGGMFRRLSREMGAAEMAEIRRQRREGDREMVVDLMEGRAVEALAKMDAAGAVHVLHGQPAVLSNMVSDWLKSARADKPGESLMLAATRADVGLLNQEARRQCREAGLLGDAEIMVGKSAFAVGDRLLFQKNDRRLGVQNGTLGTVSAIGENGLTVTLDKGGTVTVDVAIYPHISHGYAMTAHKAQGVTANSVFVYASDRMASREWGYVAGSRHRDQLHMYCDSSTYAELAEALSRSEAKEMAIDALERAGGTTKTLGIGAGEGKNADAADEQSDGSDNGIETRYPDWPTPGS